ncbi:MAG: amidohydrolase family protein, partial [Blastocatellia bacterium]|nr:amidohydrolase family protein [Blastocatellia bacterium]
MVIDINAFIGRWPYWPVPASSGGEVAAKLMAWGIERACICSTRSLFVNWEDGNVETVTAVREYPEKFFGFACLGPRELSHRRGQGRHDLAAYQRRGFYGIRLYPQHHSYHPLHEPFIDELCEDAAALSMPVLLSYRSIMNWGVPVQELSHLPALIERHPSVPWIISGVNYLHELRTAVALLRKYESVHLETSCVMGYEAIRKLVEECGHERILFGSGAPLQHGRANLEKI